jgi:2-polyprenyl-6-methoxyphenol hydroxylase-like FAD-dependent oxidoreductase
MSERSLRIIVIGGGIGGLCLAQGLRRAGRHDVTVYERDSSVRTRMQGYRLRVSPAGEQALRECLPAPLRDLLTATSNLRLVEGLRVFDERLTPLASPQHSDPRGDAPDKVDAVDRGTLRRVLLAGLDDTVRFGKRFTHCERSGDQVVAHFADGDRVTGDVLVAADGVNSRVRSRLRPGDELRDLGVRGVLSRTPRAAAIEAGLPAVAQDQFIYVVGTDGYSLGLMPMVFRSRPREAADKFWPGLEMDDPDDYYMSVFQLRQDALGMSDEAFFAMSGDDLCRLALDRTTAWHPDLRDVWGCAQPEETYPIALRARVPVTPWENGPVVPLGDAVHAMPPTGGAGANTALRDAATLCRALVAVGRGEKELPDALAEYQEQMVAYANEATRTSLATAQWFKVIDSSPSTEGNDR